MLPLSHMSEVTALCSSPQYFFNHLVGRSAHSRVPNLLASDETAVDSLSECLEDETLLHRIDLDQIENRPQRASELETLRRLYIAIGQVGIMQHQDAGNIAVAPEIRRNGQVELRWIQIRQIVKAECRVVAVDTLDFLVPVSRPQCPKDEVGPLRRGKQSEPVDATVLADPVPYLHMIGVGVLGESGRLGLLRGEKSLLLLGELEEPP